MEKDRQIKLAEYESGEDFLQSRNADILFLDIEMSGVSGIDIKETLQAEQSKRELSL